MSEIITVRQATEGYIESKRARVGLHGKFGRAAATVTTIMSDTRRAIGPIADLDICTLRHANIELAVGHWMGQPIAPRTAYKYVSAISNLLKWAGDNLPCFDMPKGVVGLFVESRPTPRQMRSKDISEFDGKALSKVLAVAPDAVRLYCLLALNTGMYQADISDLTPADLVGEYVVWSRSKTEHQSDITSRHWLWPETRKLIERCRSHQNAHSRLLVTTHGTPLVSRSTVGCRGSDSIGQAWHRACRQAHVEIAFKDLRKWGASAIARIDSMDVQRMYRGEVIRGSSAAYVAQAYEARLTPALAQWHSELATILSAVA